jgi:hypothetical protein
VTGRRGRRHGDDGVVAIELLGYLPYVVAVALMAVQLAALGGALTAAEHAARAGSRSAGTGGDATAGALQALDPGLRDRARVEAVGETVTVEIDVPIAIPLVDLDVATVTRDATLPRTGGR